MFRSHRVPGLLVLSALVSLGALVEPAVAQLSAPSLSNASSANELDPGPNTSYERESGTQTLSASASSFQTRYFALVSTDNDPFFGTASARTETLVSDYTVTFSATAPRLYQLVVATSRQGDVNMNEDGGSNADASGDMGSLACTVTGGTAVSGGCTLADPGGPITGGDNTLTVNQTNSLTLCGVSDGVGQGHSLRFQWSQSTTKSSTGLFGNADEGAVRLGGTSDVGAETAADYPGSPARTQANDGHFVTVTYTNLCGNGVIDSCGPASEACDEGSANGTFTSCCNTNCTFKAALTACSTSAGPCDVVETCTGLSGACPANGFASTSTVCRNAAGVCDLPENCTGSSPGCPFDFKAGPTSVCRPQSGVCDAQEVCPGNSDDCPGDGFAPSTTVCRPSGGVCDVVENCTGSGAACPADGFASSSTQCRGAAGVCDVAEFCTGGGAACPANGFEPSATVCRGASDVCDVAENCTGSGAACPADAVVGAGTECRASAGVCDQAEACNGVDKACPIDSVSGAFVTCRPSAGVCDPAENCDGVNVGCPADVLEPSSTQCRASAGACDVAEFCTGGGGACPGDAFAPATQECRGDTGQCDVAENCTGAGPACPADGFEPDGTPCDDGNACVTGEACQAGACTGGVGEVCTACETCVPGTGCEELPRNDCFVAVEPLRSKMLIKDTTPDTIDKVIWKWIRGETVTTADFGDPVATDDYAFCVYDGTGLVLQAAIPAGGTCGTKPCWKALNGKGFKFVDNQATPDGIAKLLLKSGTTGLSKVILKGKGANLPMPTLPFALNVQAEVRGGGKCWSTIHTATGTVRNDAGQFKSKDGN